MCCVFVLLCLHLVQFLVVLYIASYFTPMLTVLTSLYLGMFNGTSCITHTGAVPGETGRHGL